MASGNKNNDIINVQLLANLIKSKMVTYQQLDLTYNKQIIKLQKQKESIARKIDEKYNVMYVNYIFYIASVESRLLYLYIGSIIYKMKHLVIYF